ncbi:T-cell surface glycoprotein CD8 alpha chain [Archocentrus centrarchus]|uniref:T-cell surface glycoprotein CD8 alpha chain n=1 Tax=Archocentrus centrarchus TaxID=63155 RepID=UPI0011E9D443|nr:T-cell surface glycoprotein CD8 alpha chain-like [Archocentrus centrarchus]
MILLSLAWFLLTEPFWTSGSEQILMQEEVIVRYPKILGNETIECDCGSTACDLVFWFRSHISGKVEFLGRCNNADRVNYGDGVDQKRFKISKKGSNTFALRVISVTEEDKGIYSCVLKEKNVNEIWKPGTLLLPGETPPTPPPKPKPRPQPKKKKCDCSAGKGDCSMILWPLIGLLACLALVLVCTLQYFSRLPRKCHHHFVKRGR